MSEDAGESVSSVNHAFQDGLKTKYEFFPLKATRRHGNTRQSTLNFINSVYFSQQLFRWLALLAFRRPALAHYAISSGWAMEKGLIFVKLARWLGVRTVGHLHSGEFIDCWRALPLWRQNLALHEFRRLDGLIVLSDEWKKLLLHHVGLEPHKVHAVNNPIGHDFENAALRMKVERPDPRILAIGIMDSKKGVMDLLEAARMIREEVDFFIQIAGPEREPGILAKVQQFVNENGLSERISISSGVWGEEKIEAFRNAAILVLPSYFENFPLVVLEAAAAGVAIISTPVGAVPEFFHDRVSALFVEPHNPRQLADAIKRLAQDPALRSKLGRAAREVFVRRLERSKIMDSLDAVYRAAIGSGR